VKAVGIFRRQETGDRSVGVGGVVEWWSGGVVEWWSGGVVEWWSGGVVEWWSGGVVEWWPIGRGVGHRGGMGFEPESSVKREPRPILQLLNS
jgi:hypothetical protein